MNGLDHARAYIFYVPSKSRLFSFQLPMGARSCDHGTRDVQELIGNISSGFVGGGGEGDGGSVVEAKESGKAFWEARNKRPSVPFLGGEFERDSQVDGKSLFSSNASVPQHTP
ncbi:hypothetical protein ACLOJK_021323 [Asimina triloba]